MAAMIASRKAFSSSFLQKLLSPVRPIALTSSSTIRSFNTNAQMHEQGEDDRNIDVDRHSDRSISRRGGNDPSVFSNVVDPLYPSRRLSQVLNLMDRMMETPLTAMSRGMGGGPRRGFDVREDDGALYLRVDMPGLGKEDVKVSVEQDSLIIRGEGENDWEVEEEEGRRKRRYTSRIDLPQELYKLDQIKAVMKNGVLKILVPKVQEMEKKDAIHVQIDG